MVQLFCLGSPRLKLPTAPEPHTLTAKALALLVYLAVTGRPQSRDTLANLLWSEMNNQQARNNLRYTLPPVRARLDAYLLITPKTLSFNRQAPYWQDVEVLRTTLPK